MLLRHQKPASCGRGNLIWLLSRGGSLDQFQDPVSVPPREDNETPEPAIILIDAEPDRLDDDHQQHISEEREREERQRAQEDKIALQKLAENIEAEKRTQRQMLMTVVARLRLNSAFIAFKHWKSIVRVISLMHRIFSTMSRCSSIGSMLKAFTTWSLLRRPKLVVRVHLTHCDCVYAGKWHERCSFEKHLLNRLAKLRSEIDDASATVRIPARHGGILHRAQETSGVLQTAVERYTRTPASRPRVLSTRTKDGSRRDQASERSPAARKLGPNESYRHSTSFW